MNAKRLSFSLLAFVSALVACFVVYLLVILSLMWADYRFDTTLFASLIAMNIIGLIMLWQVSNKAYHQLWKVPKGKAKNEDFARLETSKMEQEELYEDDERNVRKSKL